MRSQGDFAVRRLPCDLVLRRKVPEDGEWCDLSDRLEPADARSIR